MYPYDFTRIQTFFATSNPDSQCLTQPPGSVTTLTVKTLVHLFWLLKKPLGLSRLISDTRAISAGRRDYIDTRISDILSNFFAKRDVHGTILNSYLRVESLADVYRAVRLRRSAGFSSKIDIENDYE